MERGGNIDGYEVPFHNSLAEPMLLGGVPRMYMILNFMFTMELCVGLGAYLLGVPAGLIIHFAGFALTKRDPYFFGTLNRHLRQKPYWDA